jgi:biopolymer transport protein ExbD/biopolymer transport protein TolR
MGVSSGGDRKNAIVPSMNVTPLVDVVLVLLIIFMVVTPLLAKQFWLNLPKKDDEAKQEPPPPDDADKPVVVTVEPSGKVRINQIEVERGEVKDKLARIIAARRESVIYFDAGDDVHYAIAVEVMDQARMGGAKTIAVLTEKVAR